MRPARWRPGPPGTAKPNSPLQDLMFRWQAELTAARLPARRAGGRGRRRRSRLPAARPSTSRRWPASCSAPGGRLASEKTFTRGDVVVAVAPHLHGLPDGVPRPGRRSGPGPHRRGAPARGARGEGAGVGGRVRARRRGAHRRAGREPGGPAPAPRCTGVWPCDAVDALEARLGGAADRHPAPAWLSG